MRRPQVKSETVSQSLFDNEMQLSAQYYYRVVILLLLISSPIHYLLTESIYYYYTFSVLDNMEYLPQVIFSIEMENSLNIFSLIYLVLQFVLWVSNDLCANDLMVVYTHIISTSITVNSVKYITQKTTVVYGRPPHWWWGCSRVLAGRCCGDSVSFIIFYTPTDSKQIYNIFHSNFVWIIIFI